MSFEKIHEKMLSGELYDPSIKEIFQVQFPRIEAMHKYNKTKSSVFGYLKRQRILKNNFKKVGKNCYIEPPLYANMGGLNVTLGDNFYANFHLTMVDDGEITIGNDVMIGPNCTLVTANHPISPDLRKRGIQYNKPIIIEDGVWLGANVTVMPGVKIGKNSIVGANSLVIKDVPENCVAYGNPACPKRLITKDDYIKYDHGKDIPKKI